MRPYFMPRTIKANTVGAMPHPDNPDFVQLHFWADDEVCYVILSRPNTEEMLRKLERILDAKPSPDAAREDENGPDPCAVDPGRQSGLPRS